MESKLETDALNQPSLVNDPEGQVSALSAVVHKKTTGTKIIKKWTNEEDGALKQMVTEHGTKCWSLIASKLGEHSRTGKQCRERWHNQLDPLINKDTWTPEEEALLVEAQSRLGNCWAEIGE